MADPSETTQVSREPDEREAAELLGRRAARSRRRSSRCRRSCTLFGTRHVGFLPTTVERPGWDEGRPVVRESPGWVRSVDSPRARGLAVPWLLLEILFLVAVAMLAAVAGWTRP